MNEQARSNLSPLVALPKQTAQHSTTKEHQLEKHKQIHGEKTPLSVASPFDQTLRSPRSRRNQTLRRIVGAVPDVFVSLFSGLNLYCGLQN